MWKAGLITSPRIRSDRQAGIWHLGTTLANHQLAPRRQQQILKHQAICMQKSAKCTHPTSLSMSPCSCLFEHVCISQAFFWKFLFYIPNVFSTVALQSSGLCLGGFLHRSPDPCLHGEPSPFIQSSAHSSLLLHNLSQLLCYAELLGTLWGWRFCNCKQTPSYCLHKDSQFETRICVGVIGVSLEPCTLLCAQ